MELPPAEAALLRSLSHDLPALRARVRALRSVGWTLAAIGAPLSAPRSTVRSWELHPSPSPPSPPSALSAPLPPPPAPRSPATVHPRSPAPAPSPHDAERIRVLAPRARRARAGTPPSSALARAREELNALVLRLYNEGVPVSHLADLAGVTYRAMSVRIRSAREVTP